MAELLQFGPRLPTCRLLISPEPMSGRWNMAVDEALLDAAVTSSSAVLRGYQWSEPTLSLGYFQSEDAAAANPQLAPLPSVRRLTGGGAIVHHHEWTYSCVLPPDQKRVRHPYDLYDLIHETVIQWFHETSGITLRQRGSSSRSPEEPALCFLREDSHDVCFDAMKVLGSAQRRRKGALLQHGSLVLRRSEFASEVAGICDLSPCCDFTPSAAVSLARRLALSLGEVVVDSKLTDEEERRISAIVEGGDRSSRN